MSSDIDARRADGSLTLSTSPSDAAFSLRAVALSTLKSKRRKAPTDFTPSQSYSRPPPAENEFQLDYGQEEGSVPTPATAQAAPSKPAPSESLSLNTSDTSQVREEGEISDEETAQPPAAIPNAEFVTPHLPVDEPRYRPSLSLQPIAQPSSEALDQKLDTRVVGAQHMTESAASISSPTLSFVVDSEQVRPGIHLTQGQYDRAKDLVLDLLGWGVPPEYLVDCGLHRELVYYIFTELNLRLPQNFDTAGLIRYQPTLIGTEISPAPPSERPVPILAGPPSPDQAPKPPVTESSANLVTLAPTPSFQMDVLHSPSASLHDMEQQRRQELLARKAAIASRKSKQITTSTTKESTAIEPSSDEQRDIEMVSLVPTETVDDFLKSIGPTPSTTGTEGDNILLQSKQQEPEDMDVDEIPGLGFAKSSTFSLSANIVRRNSVSDDIASSVPYPPSSTGSTVTTFSFASETSESYSQQPRRGTKRPVASDFVDYDGSRPQSTGSSYGVAPSTYALTRQKASNGFAGISTTRRCVIDLSDSEDDDQPTIIKAVEMEKRTSARTSPRPRPRGNIPSVNNSWIPSPVSTTPVPRNVLSPAALIEKENEIRRMRELIAQREQNRSKKLAAMTKSMMEAEKNKLTDKKDDKAFDVKLEEAEAPTTLPDSKVASEEPTFVSSREDSTTASRSSSVGQIQPAAQMAPASITRNGAQSDSSVVVDEDSKLWEARQDQVVAPSTVVESSSKVAPVDVDLASSSSTQVPPKTTLDHQRQDENQDRSAAWPTRQGRSDADYAPYESLFKLYPLLAMDLRHAIFSNNLTGDEMSPALSSGPSSSRLATLASPSSTYTGRVTRFAFPDIKPFERARAIKMLDPSKPICHYEIPGGGVCRDEKCEDNHLSRLVGQMGGSGTEPLDQDVANYLFNTLPVAWLAEHGISERRIQTALEEALTAAPKTGLEERVASAMAALARTAPPR